MISVTERMIIRQKRKLLRMVAEAVSAKTATAMKKETAMKITIMILTFNT